MRSPHSRKGKIGGSFFGKVQKMNHIAYYCRRMPKNLSGRACFKFKKSKILNLKHARPLKPLFGRFLSEAKKSQ
ncbi:MAG: hypothetical protein U5L45_15605 [Saprospiraceae bacterium]|nr:hypothetical protein [Saprospiraceae bacterium]